MKPIILFSIAVMLITSICPGKSSFAAVQVGSVAAVRGEAVAIGADKKQRVLQLESAIYVEDTLKTGERGRLQVLFSDSTIISIGPGSEMIVANYEWNGSSGKMENRVKEGFFHIMGGNIAKQSPENFNTKTPIATIGIRGSTYALSLTGEDLNVVFIGGTGIYVVNDAGRLEITRPGFGTTLRQKELRAPALKKFTEKELGSIMQPEKPATGEPPEKKRQPDPGTRSLPESPDRPERSERPERPDRPASIPDIDKEVDKNQQIIRRRTPVPGFTGSYMNLLTNPEESRPNINESTTGRLSGVSDEGHISGRGESTTGKVFSFDFDIPAVTPGGRYTGVIKEPDRIAAFPITGFSPETLVDTGLLHSSPGDFAILNVPMEPVLSLQKTYQYGMLGFLGIPSIQELRPSDVIYSYSGPAMGFRHLFADSFTEGGASRIQMKVNWHNNRFIGFIENDLENKTIAQFFGTIKGSEPVIAQAVFLGNVSAPSGNSDSNPRLAENSGDRLNDVRPITWMTGSETGFGRFFGSAYQGFGGLAQGGIVDVQSDQSQLSGKWDILAAAFRSLEIQTPSHGKLFLQGFVSGIADNMTAPDRDPRFFRNLSASDFRFEIDRDAGTLNGSLSARDFMNDARALSNINIGMNGQSAYIDDTFFITLLGSDNGVSSSGRTGGLKPYGNHLQPGNPETGLAAHTRWGYWEVAYDDPAGGEPFHVHVPGSLWIAGEVTPAETVRNLIETRHTGHYEGLAKGVLTTPGPTHMVAMDGLVDLNIDFAPSSRAPLSGSIHFSNPDINLVIERGAVSASGFSGSFRDTIKSDLNGGFFGPNANSVAGNFAAVLEREKAVSGVFGADRVNR